MQLLQADQAPLLAVRAWPISGKPSSTLANGVPVHHRWFLAARRRAEDLPPAHAAGRADPAYPAG